MLPPDCSVYSEEGNKDTTVLLQTSPSILKTIYILKTSSSINGRVSNVQSSMDLCPREAHLHEPTDVQLPLSTA